MTINLKKALNLTVADALALPVFSQYVFEKDGKDVEETDSIYYSDEASGISLLTNSKGVVNAIFLDSGKDGENGAFDLAPLGLDFSHTREKIRARFGKPSRTRDPFYDDMLERSCGGWDAYDYEDHTLHFEYCPQDQTVNLVTYMTPNVTEIDDDLVFLFLPSLIATLVHHEDKKGAPLTREDVLSIRDKCKVEAVTPEVYQQVSQKRGYDDIDPENCWAEWLDYKEAND